MKGIIMKIGQLFDELECTIKYEVTIWIDKTPDLKLGDCEVKQ